MTTDQTKTFILAGRAIFTVSNGKPAPDTRDYTFKVTHKAAADGRPEVYFVSLLTGSDNENDYQYLGLLDPATGRVRLTAKSTFIASSAPVVAIGWALNHIWAGRELPGGASLKHAGRCGKCARTLTVPESIESGLGPECSGLGYTKPRNERKPRAKKAPKPTFDQLRAQAAAANLAAADGLGAPAQEPTPEQALHNHVGESLEGAEIDPELEAERLLATDWEAAGRLALAQREAAREWRGLITGRPFGAGEDSVDRAERALGVQ